MSYGLLAKICVLLLLLATCVVWWGEWFLQKPGCLRPICANASLCFYVGAFCTKHKSGRKQKVDERRSFSCENQLSAFGLEFRVDAGRKANFLFNMGCFSFSPFLLTLQLSVTDVLN